MAPAACSRGGVGASGASSDAAGVVSVFSEDDPSVVSAVERELQEIAKRDAVLARGAVAATALALAREMDGHNSATSKSMCAKALMEALAELRGLAPPVERKDDLDGIKSRAALSLVGGSAAKD